MMKRALVTGCCGQDGSYLSEMLVDMGYSVVGVTRPTGECRLQNLSSILDSEDRARKLLFRLHYGDVTDPHLIVRLAQEQFDEVYLLAGQTNVPQSYLDPTYTMRVNAESPIAFFDAFKRYSPHTRIYFAGSSEMFGGMVPGTRATVNHPFEAHSPYAVAKSAAFLAARMYRRLGQFVVGSIAFNHDSRRRGAHFITRKLWLGLRAFKRTGHPVGVGHVAASRDWHHAKDTMRGAWMSLQHPEPNDYIFASGRTRSVERLIADMCDLLGVDPQRAVRVGGPEETRPWEVAYMCGDPTETENALGWAPTISYEDLLLDVSTE